MERGNNIKFINENLQGVIIDFFDYNKVLIRSKGGVEMLVDSNKIVLSEVYETSKLTVSTSTATFIDRLRELAQTANILANDYYKSPLEIQDEGEDEVAILEQAINAIATNLAIQKRRQAAQYAATKVLSEIDNVTEAIPKILKEICEALGWQWSAMWTIDIENQLLRCTGTWANDIRTMLEFSNATKHISFAKGNGLPGKVWETGKPSWIINVQTDPNFNRKIIAKKVGLCGAFFFPIRSAYDTLGVIEFLTNKEEEPDNSLLSMMNAIGSQIGQFIERKLSQQLTSQKVEELRMLHLNLEKDFTSKMKDSLRLNAQHIATKILAEAMSFEEAAPKLLKSICEGLHWDFAMMWAPNNSQEVLNSIDYWHIENHDFTAFLDMSLNMNFIKGRGLPGRVWDKGEPAWILDVVKDPNFPRAKVAEKVDLHGGFAFPIRLHGKVLGVMEFFSCQVQEPDEALLAMMGAIGSQIGQFIERKNAEHQAKIYLEQVEKQKEIVEEKQREVMDSINYAQRIQRALLASEKMLNTSFKDYFIFFQPKDVVSGDFYWASELPNKQIALLTADSTGHGVPGAIMSMLNIACLSDAVEGQKLSEPNEILNYTRSKVIKHLTNDGSEQGGRDGMDCTLMSFDFKAYKLTYSAANNALWVIRNNELLECAPDRMPVGRHDKDKISFQQHTIDMQKNDMVYAFTDGIPDQFGGERGKKLMYKPLRELLISINTMPTKDQKEKIQTFFNAWKGDLEQVDDVCLVGVRI
jgi:serine phosphatase RsbU (regulator of sigma subunit)